jgi:hypothetical protein
MKKSSIFLVLILLLTIPVFAQEPLATAVYDFSYKFDSDDGTNASGVVWHPAKERYYTFIAGNPYFPLEAFDQEGTNLYSAEIGFDARGLWYNPKTKSLESNGAGEEGWVKIVLDSDSKHSVKILQKGMFQPEFNSCGTYCPEKKAVVFFNIEAGTFDFYNYKKPTKFNSVNVGVPSSTLYDFNSTTIVYTGKKGYEFVLLNVENEKLFFFNLKGENTGETKLPALAPMPELFRFSFANNRVFLYDADERTWMAFKVF